MLETSTFCRLPHRLGAAAHQQPRIRGLAGTPRTLNNPQIWESTMPLARLQRLILAAALIGKRSGHLASEVRKEGVVGGHEVTQSYGAEDLHIDCDSAVPLQRQQRKRSPKITLLVPRACGELDLKNQKAFEMLESSLRIVRRCQIWEPTPASNVSIGHIFTRFSSDICSDGSRLHRGVVCSDLRQC